MNNIFKIVSTILMILLILILMWVLISYYSEEPISTISPDYVSETLDTTTEKQDGLDIVIKQENISDVPSEIDKEIDKYIEDANIENEPQQVTTQAQTPNDKDENPVIIQSSEQTSNAEKQEVLTEIDKTLMELLQVVDKVQPVDESRLGIEESEVQP